MTAVAVVVFLTTKFTEGAWVVTIAVPLLMFLFAHTESYYAKVASELKLGRTPSVPHRSESIVIVPTSTVNLLTERALSAALSLGDTVVAVAVAGDEEEAPPDQARLGTVARRGVALEVLARPAAGDSSARCCATSSRFKADGASVTVLIPEIIPSKRRHEILHNQRGRLLESALKAHTEGVVVATLPVPHPRLTSAGPGGRG